MNLKNIFDKARPQFEKGGKYHAFWSLFDGFESFLLVSNSTSKSGVSIHDAIDSKRIMSMVVIALLPVSVPFQPVPAGKRPLIFCPPVPGQWPA